MQRLAGREQFQTSDVADEVALAVQNDDQAITVHDRLQVARDQILQRLRLAVTGPRDNVVVLEACCRRNGEIE